ncbi:hypothetical protein [Loktanella sp. M215]|uniref:hypothetical protein n=1 Tax=Loktanella sp. M215 TaxID=2675431 RepID=UPI001F3557DD|nr:hypothetical protein [Loktanella sp. M215]MCF7702397.1 hypothetical protein [Loktanella sp. M215]
MIETIPKDKVMSTKDWGRVSTAWRNDLTERIEPLKSLGDELTGCIGCGCLSVDECPLANKDDKLSELSSGPHLLGFSETELCAVRSKQANGAATASWCFSANRAFMPCAVLFRVFAKHAFCGQNSGNGQQFFPDCFLDKILKHRTPMNSTALFHR